LRNSKTVSWGISAALAAIVLAVTLGASGLGWAQTWTHEHIDNWEVWRLDGDDRLRYDYIDGAWWNIGEFGDWSRLSSDGRTSDFIGDGGLHDLGNGFSIAYDSTLDRAFFKEGDYWRLLYFYETGQWYSAGYGTGGSCGGWCPLSASDQAAEFLGWDGWHSLGTGWEFSYDAALDWGYYRTETGSYERFAYKYVDGIWMQHGPTGNWAEFTAGGLAARFIADGCLFGLGNSWTYGYDTIRGIGFFRNDGINAWRFMYDYGLGQWYHVGSVGGWSVLGASNRPGDFLGTGGPYDLGNGFNFQYLSTEDGGAFLVGTAFRFGYKYDPGQWWHIGPTGDWDELGDPGFNARFIGDGTFFNLLNGWTFGYDAGSGMGFFRNNDLNAWRFMYRYSVGQWYHMGNNGQWNLLGASNRPSDFLGLGGAHDIGNNFYYLYTSGDVGEWYRASTAIPPGPGPLRFTYDYNGGQWKHYYNGGGFDLGPSASCSLFLADGGIHVLGNGFSYQYGNSSDMGYWLTGGKKRFHYDYGDGRWSHYGSDEVPWALSGMNTECRFLGDYTETYRLNVSTYFDYWYDASSGTGYWAWIGGGTTSKRFHYVYGDGQWFHYGPYGVGWKLSEKERSSRCIYTYNSTDRLNLGNGFEYYAVADNLTGYWYNAGGERFRYWYGLGMWHHSGPTGGFSQLTDPGTSSRFLADYNSSDALSVLCGFKYYYASGFGYWLLGSSNRFRYDYGTGQWGMWHTALTRWQTLSPTGQTADCIGDGWDHQFGRWYMNYIGDTVSIFLNVYGSGTDARNYLRYVYGTGSTGWWEDRNASFGWQEVNGYWLQSAASTVLTLHKQCSGFPDYEMSLRFGGELFDGKNIVAVYTDPAVAPGFYSWYHDYETTWWFGNWAAPGDPPSWGSWATGPTDSWRP